MSSTQTIFWEGIHSLSTPKKFTKKSTHWQDELTAKYVFFFTREAMKIAVSFSKFQCLYAMLLL